jgi:uncharacterized protein YkwD
VYVFLANTAVDTSNLVVAQKIEPAGQVLAVSDQQAIKSNNELVNSINKYRNSLDVNIVNENEKLNKLADSRLRDMRDRNYYSHINPDGLDFADLMPQFQIVNRGYACENLDMVSADNPEEAIVDWINSESHEKCLSHANVDKIGVSYADLGTVYISDIPSRSFLVVAIFAKDF